MFRYGFKDLFKKGFFTVNDPIAGFIEVPKVFSEIIDSFEIQRLRRIKQLAGASYVYPGANHTRFEHSLGVMHLALNWLSILIGKEDIEIPSELLGEVLLGALCHDLGHGPYSHNFEEIIMADSNLDHEYFTSLILRKSAIGDKITDLGLNKNRVADIASGRLGGSYYYLQQMITGSINCDSMDYLRRDSYHCGANYKGVDIYRLMFLSGVIPKNLLAFNVKAATAVENFLIARFNSFRTIYFHKTSRAVQLMLGEAMRKLNEEKGCLKFTRNTAPEEYLKWDDITLYYELKNNDSSARYIERLERRDLIKVCYEQKGHIDRDGSKVRKERPEKVREEIAHKADVDVEDVFIDFPKMYSVPYMRSEYVEPGEIILFSSDGGGKKKRERMDDHSLFLGNIKGYYRIVRVYTDKKYRERVKIAAKRVLEGMTLDEWLGSS